MVVFIDQFVYVLGQVVFEFVGGVLWQCFDVYFDVMYFVEGIGQMVCGDVDEVWCQFVLWYEGYGCVGSQCGDGFGGLYVFGEIEVVGIGIVCCVGYFYGYVIWQGVDYDVGWVQQCFQCLGI